MNWHDNHKGPGLYWVALKPLGATNYILGKADVYFRYSGEFVEPVQATGLAVEIAEFHPVDTTQYGHVDNYYCSTRFVLDEALSDVGDKPSNYGKCLFKKYDKVLWLRIPTPELPE